MSVKQDVKKKDLKAYGDTRGTGGYWRDPKTGLISKLGVDGKPEKSPDVVTLNSDETRMLGRDIIDVDEGWGDGNGSDSEDRKREEEKKRLAEEEERKRRNEEIDKKNKRYRDQAKSDADQPKEYKYLNKGRDPGPRSSSPLNVNGETMDKDYDPKDFRNFYGWVTDGNIKNINEAEEVLFVPKSKR